MTVNTHKVYAVKNAKGQRFVSSSCVQQNSVRTVVLFIILLSFLTFHQQQENVSCVGPRRPAGRGVNNTIRAKTSGKSSAESRKNESVERDPLGCSFQLCAPRAIPPYNEQHQWKGWNGRRGTGLHTVLVLAPL